jgi:hypothetical protein
MVDPGKATEVARLTGVKLLISGSMMMLAGAKTPQRLQQDRQAPRGP